MAKINWTTGGSNKLRAILYPAGLLAAGVLIWLGYFREPEVEIGTLLSSAETLARVGSFDVAEEHVQNVLEREPDNLHAHLIRAMVREYKGEHDGAIAVYRDALALTDDADLGRDIELSICDLLRRAERFAEARKALDDLAARVGEQASIHRLRGVVALDEGRLTRAVEHFDEFLAADPASSDALRLSATTLMALGRREEARAVLARAADDEQGVWSVWPDLARSCLEAGDRAGAGSALAKFMELDDRGLEKLGRHAYWADVVESGQLQELLN